MLSSRNSKARVKAVLALGLLLHRQMSYEEKHSTSVKKGNSNGMDMPQVSREVGPSAFLTPEFAELSTVSIYVRHTN